MTIEELQEEQRSYDVQYWGVNKPRERKLEHINWHLGKLKGKKLDEVLERLEHGAPPDRYDDVLWNEAEPDLCMYSLQLADLSGLGLTVTLRTELGKTNGEPLTLRVLQDGQYARDASWREREFKDNLRELTLELQVTLGDLGRLILGESESGVSMREIVVGLLRQALRLANLGHRDLEADYLLRLARNIDRIEGRV